MSSADDPKGSGLKAHKIPERSVFYDRVLPALLIALAVLTVVLVLFAIGVLAGVVPWV